MGNEAEIVIKLDPSGGVCGAQHPTQEDVTCAVPVSGEWIHKLYNAHIGIDSEGVHFAWLLQP